MSWVVELRCLDDAAEEVTEEVGCYPTEEEALARMKILKAQYPRAGGFRVVEKANA